MDDLLGDLLAAQQDVHRYLAHGQFQWGPRAAPGQRDAEQGSSGEPAPHGAGTPLVGEDPGRTGAGPELGVGTGMSSSRGEGTGIGPWGRPAW